MYHFTQSQGHTGAARLATPGRRLLAFHCVRVLSYLAFLLLLKFFSFWTRIAARSHETLCQLLGLPPCSAFEPGESAIVIVGGDDDVGRHVALSFSELGCTVFALCPDRQAVHHDGPEALGRGSDASSVSSLIQEWHKRIKRSGRLPWGLVAPIVLDMTSETQRTHAFETVNAYCATRNLHLVAVIVLPTSAPARSKPLASGRAGVEAWAEIVRKCLVEPISVVQDYANMLAAASGRVVLLLASGDQLGRPTAHLGVLHSAAQLLRQELGSFGIKVSTVAAAPFAPLAMAKPPARTGDNASTAGTLASRQRGGAPMQAAMWEALQETLQDFFVQYDDVWCVLRDIVRSRYPRERYTIGIQAHLQDVLDALPSTLRLCLRLNICRR